MTKKEDLFKLYEQTIIEIFLDDGTVYKSSPHAPSKEDWPFTCEHIYVITAWNPKSELLGDTENQSRNYELSSELSLLNLKVLPARGTSPDGLWFEESFAVINAQLEYLLSIGTQFEQNAIFEFTKESVRVIPCI